MTGVAQRHKIVVIIPVAERPQHLTNILASLLEQCRSFPYGDSDDGRLRHVAVVVADDSADADAIGRHQTIARAVDAQGLPTLYFGATEQAQLLHALPAEQRQALCHIVGDPEASGFRHKGASVTRNLASLLARQMCTANEKFLFMFVDSDEQFKVRIAATPRDREVLAIDYFDCIDRIFATGAVDVLTGKVVGDPPVSPAVMAGNFLADVADLLQTLAAVEPTQSCTCHDAATTPANDAAYHDMPELFGFAATVTPSHYRCTLGGSHDHAQCLTDFATKLDHFFDGEHPTRGSTWLPGTPGAGCLDTQAARTVYTGNYVCNRAGLAHFIPFAPLKLRMAGPVLGRLTRAAIGPRFVSANLPLLHTRTVHGDAEFRPGVSRAAADVDLTGEFERQYFGDVMLFGIERLIEQGYPERRLPDNEIRQVLDTIAHELHDRYATKRRHVQARLDHAIALFDSNGQWWNAQPELAATRECFHRFFSNIRHNFGMDSPAYRLIADPVQRRQRLDEMTQAVAGYAEDRATWQLATAPPP